MYRVSDKGLIFGILRYAIRSTFSTKNVFSFSQHCCHITALPTPAPPIMATSLGKPFTSVSKEAVVEGFDTLF